MSAKLSRDNKTAYINELREHLQAANQRCSLLEQDLHEASQTIIAQHEQISSLQDIISTHSHAADHESIMFFIDD